MNNPIYLQQRRRLDRPTLDHDLIEITEVTVTKLREYPEFNMIVGVELSRYYYIEGYPERGARLPTVNPDSQGEGKCGRCNGYIVADEPGGWRRIDELVEPARGQVDA